VGENSLDVVYVLESKASTLTAGNPDNHDTGPQRPADSRCSQYMVKMDLLNPGMIEKTRDYVLVSLIWVLVGRFRLNRTNYC
jgi:hypothetical protein